METEAILCFTFGLLIGFSAGITETIDQYIIGGSEAPIIRADNHVVLIESRQNGAPLCHGAFVQHPQGIDSQFVLTTASCMQGLAADDLTVVFGLYDRSNDTIAQPERIDVNIVYRHPYWADSAVLGYPNDLAVLTLLEIPNEAENLFIDFIYFKQEETDYKNSECWMMGWGTTTNPEDNWENKLQYANMTIMEDQDCVDAWGNYADINSGHLCARGEVVDVSACTGDSGASLHCLAEDGEIELAGIASWARTGCDPSFPTVFTHVTWYGEWLYCVIINGGTEGGDCDRRCPCDSGVCDNDCTPLF